MAIYLHREDGEHFITSNALRIELDNSRVTSENLDALSERFVVIEGRFFQTAGKTVPYFGGVVSEVYRLEALENLQDRKSQ